MQEMPRSCYWLSKLIPNMIKTRKYLRPYFTGHHDSLLVRKKKKCLIFRMEKAKGEVIYFSPNQSKVNNRTVSVFTDL